MRYFAIRWLTDIDSFIGGNMKHNRQAEIISLITEKDIETQEELLECLKERGYIVTQATISRDIREMKLTKAAGPGGKYIYSVSGQEVHGISQKTRNLLIGTVETVDRANNIAVVKTCAGMAQGAAAAIDSMGRTDIVGSVAGDDTIIIVMRTDDAAKSLCDELSDIVNENR